MRLVLAGDVMTGRGVDQVLPSPGAPDLYEDLVRDARTYVDLAERVSGPIPKPVDAAWPWGDVLPEMDEVGPAVRVMNLETSVTRSDDAALGKAVTYRMSPANLGVLTIAKVDIWALANNHILDYGSTGRGQPAWSRPRPPPRPAPRPRPPRPPRRGRGRGWRWS